MRNFSHTPAQCPNFIIGVLSIVFFSFQGHAQSSAKILPNLLNAPPDADHSSADTFAVVASFKTPVGAMRQLGLIRERFPGVHADVYSPRRKNGCCWTVVIASFAAPQDSAAAARIARRSRIASDAFVMRVSEARPHDTLALYPPSADLKGFPNGFSVIPDQVNGDNNRLILLGSYADVTSANREQSRLERQFPGLVLHVMQGPNAEFSIALAAFVDEQVKDRYLSTARAMGISASRIRDLALPPGKVSWSLLSAISDSEQAASKVKTCYESKNVTTLRQMRDCSGLWLSPLALTRCLLESVCAGLDESIDVVSYLKSLKPPITPDSVLSVDESALPIKGRAAEVASAIRTCKEKSNGSRDSFRACVAPSLLTDAESRQAACFAGARSSAEAQGCLLAKVTDPTLKTKATCVGSGLTDPKHVSDCLADPVMKARAEEIDACVASTGKNKGNLFRSCVLPALPKEQRTTAVCLTNNRTSAATALGCVIQDKAEINRIAKASSCLVAYGQDTRHVSQCLARRLGGDPNVLTSCLGSKSLTADSVAACVLPNQPMASRALRLASCVTQGASPVTLLGSCADGLVDPALRSTVAASCVVTAANQTDIVKSCLIPGLPPESQEKAQCLLKHRSDSLGAMACLVEDRSELKEARQIASCLNGISQDPNRIGLCLGRRVGGDVGKISGCLAAGPITPEAAAECAMPESPAVRQAVQLARCVATGADATSLVTTCSSGLIDPKIQTTATCIVQANGQVQGFLGCGTTAVLPPEAARLASCALSSQSVSGAALCAAKPNLNPEWQIAAECAVSTGGSLLLSLVARRVG